MKKMSKMKTIMTIITKPKLSLRMKKISSSRGNQSLVLQLTPSPKPGYKIPLSLLSPLLRHRCRPRTSNRF